MKRHPNKNNQTGFTIIEVLITIFIVGVTLVIYYATSRSVVINKYNRYKEVALRIADNKMQTLRTTAFDSLPASGTFSDSLLLSIPSGAGSITVSDLNTKTKDIKVTVTWRNPTDTLDQKVEIETYVTQGGLGQ